MERRDLRSPRKVTCARCGAAAIVSRKAKYCGKACADAAKGQHRRLPSKPCAECGRMFKPARKHNRFCSHKCSDAAYAKARIARRPTRCLWPECDDATADRRGYCKKHYERWSAANNQKFQCKCDTCGAEFRSYRDRKFCTMACYWASRRGRRVVEYRKDHCMSCGSTIEVRPGVRKRLFCDRGCTREFMAKRFDRWFANPQTIALPQGYDEFLAQPRLPCLVDGCLWEGDDLSKHMNFTHGVSKDDFKRLAGFNVRTGVIGIALYRAMRDRRLENPISPRVSALPPQHKGQPGFRTRAEGREHMRKAHALRSCMQECSK